MTTSWAHPAEPVARVGSWGPTANRLPVSVGIFGPTANPYAAEL